MPARARFDRLVQDRYAVTTVELLFQTNAEIVTDFVRGADRQALLLKCVITALGGVGDNAFNPPEGFPAFTYIMRRL